MAVLDPEHIEEYKAIIARLKDEQAADYKLKPLHTHYFRGDYTLHVRPGYTCDVRTVATRTMRCEYGNGENLKTYFMSDGCTNIVTQGNEYTNIFPAWNWRRIPGTTAPQLDTIPMAASDWQTRGTSTFAGGVSDSIYGVSAYAYMDNYAGVNTGAKKAWFFFDNEVVCLGSGINSTSYAPVYTTINQCLLDDKNILLSQNKQQTTIKERRIFLRFSLIGYYITESDISSLKAAGLNPHSRNGQRILSPSCLPFHHSSILKREKRAENETRTRDPNLGKVMLYQLSYFRIWRTGAKINSFPVSAKFFFEKV